MLNNGHSSAGAQLRQPIRRWVLGLVVGLLIIGTGATVILKRAEPILRARVIETLSARFKGPVELNEFHVSLSHGVQVQGDGLKIYGEQDPNIHKPGIQPLIEIAHFTFQTRILELMRSPMRVESINLKGLRLNLPPKEQRQAGPGAMLRKAKAKIQVHHFACEQATLIINTSRIDKLPLEFDITDLKMTSDHPGQPLHFEARLTNPKPVGDIATRGMFGPWQPDSPRDTAISGEYSFTNADLSTIKGIGGMLSSNGIDLALPICISLRGPEGKTASWVKLVKRSLWDKKLQPVRLILKVKDVTAAGKLLSVREREHAKAMIFDRTAGIHSWLLLGLFVAIQIPRIQLRVGQKRGHGSTGVLIRTLLKVDGQHVIAVQPGIRCGKNRLSQRDVFPDKNIRPG